MLQIINYLGKKYVVSQRPNGKVCVTNLSMLTKGDKISANDIIDLHIKLKECNDLSREVRTTRRG